MRKYLLAGMLVLGAVTLILRPADLKGQFGGKFGGGSSGFMNMDPNFLFDRYAKTRPYFLISDTRSMGAELAQYAAQKGITNGQITRPQFLAFWEQKKAKMASGEVPAFPSRGPRPDGSKPGGNVAPPSTDMIYQLADADFKRRDHNGDGKLTPEEMPSSLRDGLAKYDLNNDGLIDPTEYRAFFAARLTGGDQGAAPNAAVTTIIIEEEEDWDRRPTVLRAGKLPKNGLPTWFKELDTDSDGQVALFEWRKGGKNLDEFKDWDLDDDGFITPEEAMRHHAILAKSSKTGDNPNVVLNGTSEGGTMMRSPWGGKGPDGGGRSPWGGKGFSKKKKDGSQ